MRAVYVYDGQTKMFLYPRVFEDNDNTVIPNSTTIPVPDNLWGKKYFDVDKQEWHGMTKEEYLKANPPKVEPSQSQKLLMAQQANITELQKTVMNQQATTVQLQQLVMTQQAEITQLKKGAN